MKRLSGLIDENLWIQEHQGVVGLAVATVLGVALVSGIILLVSPKPGRMDVPVHGRITGFILHESKFGAYRQAIVSTADGRTTPVKIPSLTRCQVGGDIAVSKREKIWGHIYVAGYGYGCAP